MGKLNAYMGLFGLVTVGLLVYFMFFNGSRTASVSSKAEASFLGRKRRK